MQQSCDPATQWGPSGALTHALLGHVMWSQDGGLTMWCCWSSQHQDGPRGAAAEAQSQPALQQHTQTLLCELIAFASSQAPHLFMLHL